VRDFPPARTLAAHIGAAPGATGDAFLANVRPAGAVNQVMNRNVLTMRSLIARLSLRAKILASGIIVLSGMSLFTSLYYPLLQRETALASMRERSGTLAATLAVWIGITLEDHDFGAASAALDWAKKDSTLQYILVVDNAGDVFASYNPSQIAIDVRAVAARTGLTETEDAIRVTAPVRFHGHSQGTLLIEMSLRHVHAQVRRDIITALIVSLLSMALGVFFLALLARRITAPITALREATDKVSRGDYGVTELPVGDGELGALSGAFNLMTRTIAESIAQAEQQAREVVEARDAAIESANKYRLLFDLNPEPMWVYDGETLRFLAVNEAAIRHYGYTRDEFLAMTIRGIRSESEYLQLDEGLKKNTGTTMIRTNARHLKKDGTAIEVELSADAIEIEGRKARLVMAHDVTGRKRLEDQFRQAQKMEAVGQLAGGVAHDFNNLLTVIGAHSDFLLDAIEANDPKREDVEEIQKAGVRASGLTRQLLAFSRKQILRPAVLDLNKTVESAEKMLRRLIGDHIQVSTILSPDLPHILADSGQLEQVLVNLAVNARDAMPDGGRLEIDTSSVEVSEQSIDSNSVTPPGKYVLLCVSDTGTGMDAATRKRVFEPFFTTKDPGKGTGLGLATVYGIIKQSGGYIWVDSEPGSGTTFRIYLPQLAKELLPQEITNAAVAISKGMETILLVEDEDSLRRVVNRMLSAQGYVVLEARDGDDALSIAAGYGAPIHLVLSDVVMPGTHGGEVCRRLRLERPDIKTISMSGYTDDEVVRRGIVAGDMPFIQKPFSQTDLARLVRETLDGSSVPPAHALPPSNGRAKQLAVA
jgi:two-component system cell cycle sensor histidine kinase/response regulator CckA